MATQLDVDALDQPAGGDGPPPGDTTDPRPRPRRWARVLLVMLAVLVVVVLAGGAWSVLGKDSATVLSGDEALEQFRSSGGADQAAEGRPEPGVYDASASGTESIGLPGFDEQLGPSAPVTVTYGDAGCFTYRADFNSHHWRSWTFCPTSTATFAITQLQTWTARNAPGLDIETLSTYDCTRPLDTVWAGAAIGERRTSQCTGTTDVDDTVTQDAGEAEVLETEQIDVDGTSVQTVRLRTTDTFSGDQTGGESAEWWLHPDTGLPLRLVLESTAIGASEYRESFDLRLDTLTPAT